MSENYPYKQPVKHRQNRRCQGHDYSARGIYMLTLVVKDRRPILGEIVGPSCAASVSDRKPSCAASVSESVSPRIALTPLGEAVEREFNNLPTYYPQISIISQQVMPDHWHGLLFVKDNLPLGLSHVLAGFQSGCSRAMWDMEDIAAGRNPADRPPQKIHQRPGLFEKGFNDGIVWRKGQLEKYKRYIADNPQRAWIRKTHPDIMRRCLHIQIDGRDYAAFGNIFLLRKPDKQQVFCHRWEQSPSLTLGKQNLTRPVPGASATGNRRPYEQTETFASEREQWLAAARQGVVTVTPGISKGEQIIKADCLKERLPLIHIQKEPIGPYWKPEESRFYACAEGSLLILAPWSLIEMGDTHKRLADGSEITIAADTDYSQFHNMNTLAAEICAFEGEARIIPLANARGTEQRQPLANARGAEPHPSCVSSVSEKNKPL